MKPMQPQYSWETQHDTANGTMTHTFNKLVKVVSNMHTGEAVVMVGDKAVQTYGNMPVKQYEEMLLEVERKAVVMAKWHKFKTALAKAGVYTLMVVAMFAFMALGADSDNITLGAFATQKVACMGVIGVCAMGIKYTPTLAQAWKSINN